MVGLINLNVGKETHDNHPIGHCKSKSTACKIKFIQFAHLIFNPMLNGIINSKMIKKKRTTEIGKINRSELICSQFVPINWHKLEVKIRV